VEAFITNDLSSEKRLTWAINNANDLSVYRNDMIHSAMAYLLDMDRLVTTSTAQKAPPKSC
jgi:hypothetical protein